MKRTAHIEPDLECLRKRTRLLIFSNQPQQNTILLGIQIEQPSDIFPHNWLSETGKDGLNRFSNSAINTWISSREWLILLRSSRRITNGITSIGSRLAALLIAARC